RAETYRLHTVRKLSRLSHGESIGAEASMTKVLWSELGRDAYLYGRELLGPLGESLDETADDWRHGYWLSRASTIYAGTSEIQRNIIAERVLGLPKWTSTSPTSSTHCGTWRATCSSGSLRRRASASC